MGVAVHDGGACGSDQCDGGGVGGCGCVVVIVFLPETGSEPQQRCDCRFTYVCQTFARATHLSDSLCLSDYVFWLIVFDFRYQNENNENNEGFQMPIEAFHQDANRSQKTHV